MDGDHRCDARRDEQRGILEIATRWLETAKHPRFKRLYTELVYQPMAEVMDYLRTNGFRTYIVTGGGQEFIGLQPTRLRHPAGASGRLKYRDKIRIQRG